VLLSTEVKELPAWEKAIKDFVLFTLEPGLEHECPPDCPDSQWLQFSWLYSPANASCRAQTSRQ
jgi:hypothetical protein